MDKSGKADQFLNAKINIVKLPLNTVKFYELGKSCDWLKNILLELNEKADEKSPEEYLEETSISCELEIKKMFKQQYGDMIFVRGNIETQFKTQCVRTLENMDDNLILPINSCFLDQKFEETEEFSEQLEIFEENQLFDLYFFDKGFVNIAEMIHEQIYLNINQYPIANPDTPLDWANGPSNTKQ